MHPGVRHSGVRTCDSWLMIPVFFPAARGCRLAGVEVLLQRLSEMLPDNPLLHMLAHALEELLKASQDARVSTPPTHTHTHMHTHIYTYA